MCTIFYHSEFHTVVKPSELFSSSKFNHNKVIVSFKSSRYLDVHSRGAMWGFPMSGLRHRI